MHVLATRRVWFLGVMKIPDQNAWKWLFIKVGSRKDVISKHYEIVVFLMPINLCSLLRFGTAFDVHSSPFLGSLPLIFPVWSSLNILSSSGVKWWMNTAVSWDQFRDCCLVCRSWRFSAALAWSPHGTSCPPPPGFVSFVVSDTISSAGTRRKGKSFFPMWLLSLVTCVDCGIFHLCVTSCSKIPLETTRR